MPIFIIVRTLTSGIEVPGYASLMVAVLFLGGLQLLSLGVLGEYVGRILTETKGRPLYVVRETHRRGRRLMERKVYRPDGASSTADHWWFTARRRILDATDRADRAKPPATGARILELGCGTGHNLAMLSRFGRVEASELDPVARKLASERLGRPVVEAALPDLLDVSGDSYDLVALLDVLEHVPDDQGRCCDPCRAAEARRTLLLTVPINPGCGARTTSPTIHSPPLPQARDPQARQRRRRLMHIDLLSPFNSLLFPPIAAVRLSAS